MSKYADIPSHIHSRILEKKTKFQSQGKLSAKKISDIEANMQVDFVYHSNRIEGSQLTRGETALVMRGITIGGKDLQTALAGKEPADYYAARNHPEAIDIVKEISFNKTYKITTNDILHIHKVAMKDIISTNGEYRHAQWQPAGAGFTAPPFHEVPKYMKELVDMINENPDELRPIELATQAHYDLSWIHPFEDGNGRIARLLLNLILVRNGYPFAVIKSVDRQTYLRTLRIMDVDGDFEPFLTYIARCIEQTLDIYLSESGKGKPKLELFSKLAKDTPYSAEYWSLLARKGRIDAIKKGKVWYSSKSTIKEYLEQQKGRHKKPKHNLQSL